MSNPLQPSGRTRPVAAYIAVRDNGPFNNAARTRGVTAAASKAGPANGAGVGGARLGGRNNPDGVVLQNLGKV
jgi:hypothetical protein